MMCILCEENPAHLEYGEPMRCHKCHAGSIAANALRRIPNREAFIMSDKLSEELLVLVCKRLTSFDPASSGGIDNEELAIATNAAATLFAGFIAISRLQHPHLADRVERLIMMNLARETQRLKTKSVDVMRKGMN